MAELAEDWPSLAPIRTSCSPRSNSCSSSHSISSSAGSSHHLAPAYRLSAERAFQSPPSSSSSSSHIKSLLPNSSSTSKGHGHGLLSKCLPPRPLHAAASHHGFPRQSMSGSPGAGRLQCGSGGGAFRSYASFPSTKGSMCNAATAAAAVSASSSHSGPLHGSGICKGHLITVNAFTMIPAAVVGKKKPPDYLSDEPTSPEVTCIGRVRRSKSSTCNWDALANGSQKLCKKKRKTSKKKVECHNAVSDIDLQLAASIPRPLCMDSSQEATVPKWRKIISLFKDIRDLHTPHFHIRKLRQDYFVVNLDRLWSTQQRIAKASHHDGNQIEEKDAAIIADRREVLNYLCQSGELEEGEENLADDIVAQEEGRIEDDSTSHGVAPLSPPNACLLLMGNKSGRNKIFHDDDDDNNGEDNAKNGSDFTGAVHPPCLPPALKHSTAPSAAHPIQKCNQKKGFSFWKTKKLSSSLIKAFVER